MRISQFDFEPLPIRITGSGKIKKEEIQSSRLKPTKTEKHIRNSKPVRSNSARRIDVKKEVQKEQEDRTSVLHNNFFSSENENVF